LRFESDKALYAVELVTASRLVLQDGDITDGCLRQSSWLPGQHEIISESPKV